MEEQTQMQVPVRRRRKQKPTWERTLRKFWPTIRFVLICMLAVLIAVLLIKLLVFGVKSLFKGDDAQAYVPYSYSQEAEVSCETPLEAFLEDALRV